MINRHILYGSNRNKYTVDNYAVVPGINQNIYHSTGSTCSRISTVQLCYAPSAIHWVLQIILTTATDTVASFIIRGRRTDVHGASCIDNTCP